MKFILNATLVALTPLAFISCNDQTSETNTESVSTAEVVAKPYPLETCLVSGKKLGSMGDPYEIVHEGQQIKFCCDGCEPAFKKDPAKYLAKLSQQ
ncbi:YHS domain-containing protein [Rubritalea marina]|jgi:YHS domain-containing protein|uniref:YHS domain-containing protein n=1 Tax=Rubritalea marina TaxID=361055 RepID=UPI00035F319D|nr:YHS domain-containing protein [Rubritalea marina]